MKRAFVVVFGMLALLMNVAYAQKPAVVISNEAGWHKIGEVTADFDAEEESIAIFGADRFKAIKLRVTDAPINIQSLVIQYEGEGDHVQEVNVSNELQAGAETRVIQLDHPNTELEKVTFVYKTLPNRQDEKAEVELYGLKTGEEGNAYREDREEAENDMKDAGRDINREANETSREIENETEEAGDDIQRETNEAKQEVKEEAAEAEKEIDEETKDADNTADKVGDDISEAAGNVGAEIKDKPYVDKVGPDGQKIYMDKHSNYYYINDEGKKVYISKSEMKDNPDRD